MLLSSSTNSPPFNPFEITVPYVELVFSFAPCCSHKLSGMFFKLRRTRTATRTIDLTLTMNLVLCSVNVHSRLTTGIVVHGWFTEPSGRHTAINVLILFVFLFPRVLLWFFLEFRFAQRTAGQVFFILIFQDKISFKDRENEHYFRLPVSILSPRPAPTHSIISISCAPESSESPRNPIPAINSLSQATQTSSFRPPRTNVPHRFQTAGFSGHCLTACRPVSLAPETPNHTSGSSSHSVH